MKKENKETVVDAKEQSTKDTKGIELANRITDMLKAEGYMIEAYLSYSRNAIVPLAGIKKIKDENQKQ